MSLSKADYPEGPLLRAVWDCCDELYLELGHPPSRKQFIAEIEKREPERKGISTHSRQWGEWMRHHGFKSNEIEAECEYRDKSSIPDEYMYPQYLRVIYAIDQLGAAGSRHIDAWLREQRATLKKSEIDFQLNALTVNSKHRYRHRGSRKNMRSDQGNRLDAFFRSGEGLDTRYVRYEQEIHGVWDLNDDGKTPIMIDPPSPSYTFLLVARKQITWGVEDEDYYDARIRVMREIALREGQPVFRRRLIEAYSGQCAVTGCAIRELLEAAHIRPYAGAYHCQARHGILLRSDIHTLFDRGLLWLDADYKVCLAEALYKTEYGHFQGKKIRLPEDKLSRPFEQHVTEHRNFCMKENKLC